MPNKGRSLSLKRDNTVIARLAQNCRYYISTRAILGDMALSPHSFEIEKRSCASNLGAGD
ncbi:hypothetical protein [Vibrio rhizosphaerae]|uniref:Uncharacterized protein n=1 Tax=Vibrio rhizosphaerae TaxID=398736 RepID=A0ABU4IYL5_9VIBR|nr:hypothetical protein [Vibrio rhizosphaerae]MDW6094379.1 hypothetical protein [Vibrio rhizosphaerae]